MRRSAAAFPHVETWNLETDAGWLAALDSSSIDSVDDEEFIRARPVGEDIWTGLDRDSRAASIEDRSHRSR